MSDADNLRATGDRIARLLEQFESLPDPRPAGWAEELLRLVTSMYGEGLTRVLELACGPEPVAGPALLTRLAEDDLLASLLLLHGLHPDAMQRRVERALAGLEGSLGSADVRLLEVDEDEASVRVRLLADHGRACVSLTRAARASSDRRCRTGGACHRDRTTGAEHPGAPRPASVG